MSKAAAQSLSKRGRWWIGELDWRFPDELDLNC